MRVPVTVVEHDNVCSRQVDTETASTRREQEDELLAVRLVVLVDGNNTVLMSRATVDTAILYTA